MTAAPDDPADVLIQPPPEPTPANAQALKATSVELYAQAAQLQTEALRAAARAEIVGWLTEARIDVHSAELELDEARKALADATAEYDPVAADLARCQAELSATTVTGRFEEQISARIRRIALEEYLGPLQEQAARLGDRVGSYRALAESLERDSLAWHRATLAEAEAAYRNPPLHDLAKLKGADRGTPVAPFAASVYATYAGIDLLVREPERVREPHGLQILISIISALKMSGAFALIREEVEGHLADLLTLHDPRAAQALRQAMWQRDNADLVKVRNIPEYKGITGEASDQLEEARRAGTVIDVDPATGQPPVIDPLSRFPVVQVGKNELGAQLPAYDSPEGERLRRADRDSRPQVRGPFTGFARSVDPSRPA